LWRAIAAARGIHCFLSLARFAAAVCVCVDVNVGNATCCFSWDLSSILLGHRLDKTQALVLLCDGVDTTHSKEIINDRSVCVISQRLSLRACALTLCRLEFLHPNNSLGAGETELIKVRLCWEKQT